MHQRLRKILMMLLINILVIGNYTLISVNAQNNVMDTPLLEEHKGGFVDYTEMYGLEKSKSKPITYNRFQRSTATQENNYLAILVEFPDKPTTSLDDSLTLSKANSLMNTGNVNMDIVNDKVPVLSMKQYVEKYTYNKMTTTTSFFPQDINGKVTSVKLSKNRSYYMKWSNSNKEGYTSNSQKSQREKELINEVLSKSKESIERVLSAGDLDKNNDGYIDAISFFVEADSATEDKVQWSDLLWSHKISGMNPNVKLHGKTVDTYNLINTYDSMHAGGVFSLNQSTYGTIIHEYMHILGLPDLYRYNNNGNPVGFYDVMAETTYYNPQGILAYMSSEYNNLGWSNKLPEIMTSGTITLNRPQYANPGEKRAVKLYSPYNNKEFFVVEFYEKRNDVRGDATSNNDGLIVYRINSEIKDGNISNSDDGRKDYLYIFRPEESQLGKGEGDLRNAVLNKYNRNRFGKPRVSTNKWDNDTLFYSDGSNSGIVINVVSSNDNSITFNVTIPSSSTNIPITGITLDKSYLTLNVNQSMLLNAQIEPSNTTNNKILTWKTSNSNVAKVDSDGRVTGVSAGIATITATTINGIIAKCFVTVSNPNSSISYSTHIQDIGWQAKKYDGAMSGTVGKVKQLEAIKIILENPEYNGSVQYKSHIEDYGWEKDWKSSGEISGTSGKAKQLEAVQIKLTDEMSAHYDIYYRVHVEDYGWLDWAKNGEIAGTTGLAKQLEAIEIKLVKRGGEAPGNTERPHIQRYISYSTHIQDIGWQAKKYDGAMSGTVGRAKQLEAIKIALENQLFTGSVQYRTYIQGIGWQNWQSDGVTVGTTGQSMPLEAMQIKLTGEMANNYDIYYRVHVEDYGWLDWAKNGEIAGTTGLSKHVEAIEIKLEKIKITN